MIYTIVFRNKSITFYLDEHWNVLRTEETVKDNSKLLDFGK